MMITNEKITSDKVVEPYSTKKSIIQRRMMSVRPSVRPSEA